MVPAGDRQVAAAAKTEIPISAPPAMSGGSNSLEDGKIRMQLDAIRTFVRVADKSCFVVPLVKGVINITASEAEALRADFVAEKSFRADNANVVGLDQPGNACQEQNAPDLPAHGQTIDSRRNRPCGRRIRIRIRTCEWVIRIIFSRLVT